MQNSSYTAEVTITGCENSSRKSMPYRAGAVGWSMIAHQHPKPRASAPAISRRAARLRGRCIKRGKLHSDSSRRFVTLAPIPTRLIHLDAATARPTCACDKPDGGTRIAMVYGECTPEPFLGKHHVSDRCGQQAAGLILDRGCDKFLISPFTRFNDGHESKCELMVIAHHGQGVNSAIRQITPLPRPD
ncbi:MAG: hypothetical protein IPH37_11925 [Burkholderiales bacterium]|nr:hypothetical protein [Burkholderiales bacterium]